MQKAAEEDPFKPDEGVTMEEDKIVLLGDEELNAAMAKYYEAHPSAFQWSLWQQVEYSRSPSLYPPSLFIRSKSLLTQFRDKYECVLCLLTW